MYDQLEEPLTVANYKLVGRTRGHTFGGQPGSAQPMHATSCPLQLPDSFAFRNSTVPLAGSLSMPFRTASRASGTMGGTGNLATGTLRGTGNLAAGTMGNSGSLAAGTAPNLPHRQPAAQPERAASLGGGNTDNVDDIQQCMRSLGLEPVPGVSGNTVQ